LDLGVKGRWLYREEMGKEEAEVANATEGERWNELGMANGL
jgi:rubredoxin